jgi:hypothetical protein
MVTTFNASNIEAELETLVDNWLTDVQRRGAELYAVTGRHSDLPPRATVDSLSRLPAVGGGFRARVPYSRLNEYVARD